MTFKVRKIYNNLLDFESKIKNKKGDKQLYPIHKKLQFSEEKYNDITDWIIDHLKINEKDLILDAGCGVGYVLTRVCINKNCRGIGISLSEKEIAYANNVCKLQGLENQVSFEQAGFDDKLNVQFDVIIAIESIKHSESIQNTTENLVAHLKPGGYLFILDDYITDMRFQFLKKQIKKYWAVSSFYSFNSVAEKLTELKLPFEVIDFTQNVAYTNKRYTAAKFLIMSMFLPLAKLFPFFKIYTIYFAGFCLERLYKKKAMEYKAIIAANIIRT